MSQRLTGWRFAALVGTLFGSVGLALYPIAIHPYYNQEAYKKSYNEARKQMNVKPEDITRGMKVWTDPFDRPAKPGNK